MKKLITPFIILILILCILSSLGNQSTTVDNTPIPSSTSAIIKITQKIIPTITKTRKPTLTPTVSNSGSAEISVNLCNLRSGPGLNFSIVGSSSIGETHKVYGTDATRNWLLLDKSKSIWVSLTVVTLSKSISNIPIISNLSALEGYKVPVPTISMAGFIPASTDVILVPTKVPEAEIPDPTDEPVPSNCHPSYPTVCIPYPPPDLDCKHISDNNFRVLPPDPHNFDGDHDGWGCEW